MSEFNVGDRVKVVADRDRLRHIGLIGSAAPAVIADPYGRVTKRGDDQDNNGLPYVVWMETGRNYWYFASCDLELVDTEPLVSVWTHLTSASVKVQVPAGKTGDRYVITEAVKTKLGDDVLVGVVDTWREA